MIYIIIFKIKLKEIYIINLTLIDLFEMDELNYRNVRIQIKDVENIFKQADINSKINDLKLYQKAFVQKSYVKDINYDLLKDIITIKKDIIDFQKESNERFEFCGDSIISHVICEYIFLRFPELDEGIMTTNLKTKIVSRGYLSVFAKQYGFSKFLLLSNHMEKIHSRDYYRILEDAFEAFICAMNMDLGFNITKKFIINTIEKYVNFTEILELNNNYKDRIKHYYQKKGQNEPKYEIDCELGPPTKRTFIMNIYENYKNEKNQWVKKFLAKGYGFNKKESEQNAAYNSLKRLNLLERFEEYRK